MNIFLTFSGLKNYLLLAAKYPSTFEWPKVEQKPQLEFFQNIIHKTYSILKFRTTSALRVSEILNVHKSIHSFFKKIVGIFSYTKNRLLDFAT